MPLVDCPSCKRSISSEAISCPKCGHPLARGWSEHATQIQRDRRKVSAGIAVAIVIVLALTVLFSRSDNEDGNRISGSTSSPTAIDMMESTFVGGYSRSEIKSRIDRVLISYGLPRSEENYSRVASMLIGLRRETGVPEMATLNCMNSGDFEVFLEIDQAAGVCAATLEAQM